MYDPSLYKDSAKLETLTNMVSAALADLKWKELYTSLSTEEKETDAPLTWYAAWCKNHEVMFESNSELAHKIGDDSGDLEGALNFHIELTNNTQFKEVKDYVFSLYGVTYAGFHFLTPQAIVPEHTDKDALSILFMYQVGTDNVLLVGEEKYNFIKGQVFAFDASIKHSAYNNSTEDWIMFAIRCTRDSFNL